MKKIPYIILFAILALSCQKQVPFSVPDCQKSYSFEAAGGTVFATVLGSEKFTVTSSQDWCYTQAYNPGADNNLRITAKLNSNAYSREAVVTVSCEGSSPIEIKVVQEAADPYIKCNPASVAIKDTDTSFVITVNANTDYTVSTGDWIVFDQSQKTGIGTCELKFTVTGTCPDGSTRSSNVTFTAPNLTVVTNVEQATWETVTMMWGVDDIKYIWEAFGKTSSAITQKTIGETDFGQYDRLTKISGNAGFIYTNESGALTVAMGATAQFKMAKASSKGNLNRDGKSAERMQLNATKKETPENCFIFTAPRSGSLEIEAAAPSDSDKEPMIKVNDTVYENAFKATYASKADVTTINIDVTDITKGAEVKIYGNGGAINYFCITYTYLRPVVQ